MTGLVLLKAASRRVVSREGAGRALSKRVKVGECFLGAVMYLRPMLMVRKERVVGSGFWEVHVIESHRVFSACVKAFL